MFLYNWTENSFLNLQFLKHLSKSVVLVVCVCVLVCTCMCVCACVILFIIVVGNNLLNL